MISEILNKLDAVQLMSVLGVAALMGMAAFVLTGIFIYEMTKLLRKPK